MTGRLTRDDYDLLLTLADCRVLTCEQLATLCGRNVAAVRRRLRFLKEEGLIKVMARTFGEGPGRPDGLVSLGGQSVDALKDEGLIPENVPPEQLTVDRLFCVEHQRVINETRIQLVAMQRSMSEFQVRFFQPVSLHSESGHAIPSIADQGTRAGRGATENDTFIPDGVFVVTHQQAQKTLLFFLEIDMNTQPLSSQSPYKRDIQRKIASYQQYFRHDGFRRYEDPCGYPLHGFRLLFVTTHTPRLSALCRVVRGMPPSGFIWLTDRPSLGSHGIWAPIWIAGGIDTQPRQSILGTRTPDPCPPPGPVLEARASVGGVRGWLTWMFGRSRDRKGQSALQ